MVKIILVLQNGNLHLHMWKKEQFLIGSLHGATLQNLEQNVATVVRTLQASETVSSVTRKDRCQVLFDTIHWNTDTLSEGEHIKLLTQYQDVFAPDNSDLGSTNLVQHHIETGEARPIHQHPC